MSIANGTYYIHSGLNTGTDFVGTGPVPPIWPPPPVPLQIVPEDFKDKFEIVPLEGNKYTLKHSSFNLFVGYNDDFVRLMEMGSNPQPWSIEAAGSDSYLIQLPDSDLGWTAGTEYNPIKLQPKNGTPNQQWRLIPYKV